MDQQRLSGEALYAFLDSQHKLLATAAAVFRDDAERFLLLKTWYRDSLVLPGGLLEPGDSPRRAAAREVREEIGLDVPIGRLLVVDYRSPSVDAPACLHFIFDGGRLGPQQRESIVLQPDEIVEARWVSSAEMGKLVSPGSSARRVLQAVAALADGSTRYVEDGRP